MESIATVLRDNVSPKATGFAYWHLLTAEVALRQGRYEQAREHAHTASTLLGPTGSLHMDIPDQTVLGRVLVKQGRWPQAQAQAQLEQALENSLRDTPPQPLRQAKVWLAQAGWHQARGQHAKALPLLEEALQARLGALGPQSLWVGEARLELARSLLGVGQAPKALEQAQEAQSTLLQQLGQRALWVGDAQQVHAEALLALRQPAEAVQLLEQALEVARDEQLDPNLVAYRSFLLAQALHQAQCHPERVAALMAQAREQYALTQWPNHSQRQHLESWARLLPTRR